jgi:hypothetical protein
MDHIKLPRELAHQLGLNVKNAIVHRAVEGKKETTGKLGHYAIYQTLLQSSNIRTKPVKRSRLQ